MRPVLFHIFDLPIPSYGVFAALGSLTAFVYAYYEARRAGLDAEKILEVYFWIFLTTAVMSRVFEVVVEWGFYSAHPVRMFYIWDGGMVLYGGLTGAVIAGVAAVRIKKLPLGESADALITGAAIGIMLGRVGCLMSGCCYGRPTDAAWCIRFTNRHSAANSVVGDVCVHPTQIYSILLLAAVFVFLVWLSRRKKFSGMLFWMFFLLYPAGRFVIEIYRGDPRGMVREPVLSRIFAPILANQTYSADGVVGFYHAPYLSTSQAISLAVFTISVAGYFLASRRAKAALLQPESNHDINE